MYDRDDYGPAQAQRDTWRWLPVGISGVVAGSIIAFVAAVTITCICVFVVHVGGILQKQAIKNSNSNTVSSQGYQDTLITEMQANLDNIEGPGGIAESRRALVPGSQQDADVRGQEIAQLRKFCSEGSKLDFTTLGADSVQSDYNANCSAGSVVAHPPLAPATQS